jgi:tripartite-type tricarboxylate transporter receptor subunit TctC
MSYRIWAASFLAACASMAAMPVHAQQSVADFYAGKRITVVVGSETGGGYDTNARLLSRHLGKYLPGNPQIIVQNMPGAGSIVATNYLCNVAPKDGTFLGMVQRGMLMAKLTQQNGVQFDPEKINWLGNMSSEASLVIAWHTAPQKRTQDLFTSEMVVGGAGATADTESTPRLLNATIGTKFKIIPGYKGSSSLLLSIENGELQGIADWAWPNIKSRRPDFLRDKKITLLLQNGLQKEADLPDVPLALDYAKTPEDRKVLELYYAQKNVARPLMAPPGVPADRVAALRAAFEKMAVDPEFLDDAKKSGLDVDPMNGAAVDKIMALIASTPPAIAKRLADAITPPQ